MSPSCGSLRVARCSYRPYADLGGNMPWSNSGPSSHWVPGAISNGPMSGVVSTSVTLNASEVSRRPSRPWADGKSRCQGWFFAPGSGTSNPTSTISYASVSTAAQIPATHGWVASSTKPRSCSGCSSL